MTIKGSYQTMDGVINKMVDEIQRIKTVTVEPGAEIAQNLSTVIDTIVKDSVHSGCDLAEISKGILIGSFRSNRSLKLEAHKTIRLLIQEIVQSAFSCKGDIKKAVEGLLGGIITIAKEQELNAQEALVIAREDIFISVKKINTQLADEIKAMIQKNVLS